VELILQKEKHPQYPDLLIAIKGVDEGNWREKHHLHHNNDDIYFIEMAPTEVGVFPSNSISNEGDDQINQREGGTRDVYFTHRRENRVARQRVS
jgi:hypothetical protein